ncbi:DUF3180 domain-containing protein [Actinocorallia sp. A-T 12471]|uniref:DUF3180 domain-containing protein n=1 Tax=Actinocorallia sp. A-T 12471 TaxID=3089813 RepID=UPI0029CE6606|nr:DUF3180 domain-containing protein [Actinocorallia sp. A-T 12471]MDX6741819.1 DUF3180 domain-containing protein [Actinocorallia sp. A-T 12471]
MRATRPAVLLALVAVPALVVWAVLRGFYSQLPPLPWTAVPTFLLLAIGEVFAGFSTRNKILHKSAAEAARPVDPLSVARLAVLGKASAHAAAALAGVFLGFVLFVAGDLDKPTLRHDFFVSGATALSAFVLAGAGLFLEWCCRIPKDDNSDKD